MPFRIDLHAPIGGPLSGPSVVLERVDWTGVQLSSGAAQVGGPLADVRGMPLNRLELILIAAVWAYYGVACWAALALV